MFNVGTIAKSIPTGLSIVGISQGKAEASGDVSVVLTEPSGSQANDVFISFFSTYNNSGAGNPGTSLAGWSTFNSGNAPDGFGAYRLAGVRRGASPPSLTFSNSVTLAGEPLMIGALLVVVRGAPTSGTVSSIVEGTSASSVVGNGVGTATPRTITTTGNKHLCLHFFHKFFQSGEEGTPTGSWIELFDNSLTGGGSTQNGIIDYQLLPTAGSVTGRNNVANTATIINSAGLAIKAS